MDRNPTPKCPCSVPIVFTESWQEIMTNAQYLWLYTIIKHYVTIVHDFYNVHILCTMHWNPFAENSKGWQEYWHKLVPRPRPFAQFVFLHCRCSQRTSYVSYHTEIGIHNVSQKFSPEPKNQIKVNFFLIDHIFLM